MTARTIERRVVRADGLETSYLEAGPAAAPPLVLLHDATYGSDAESCWAGLIPRLATRYRVLAPDLIGHGGTRKIYAFDRDPMRQRLDHVRRFCDTLALDLPFLAGSSFGAGMVLRGIATKALRARAAISIGGTGGLYLNPEKCALLQRYQPTEQWARAVSELMAGTDLTRRTADRLARSRAAGHFETLAADRVLKPVVREPRPDWRPGYLESLTRVAAPVLLIAGAEDPLFEPGFAHQLVGHLPRGQAVTLAGARHQPHLDAPAAVAHLMLDFLDRVRGQL